jgi:hypothetical protein
VAFFSEKLGGPRLNYSTYCNPQPLRLGLSLFFFYNKILQRSIRSIRVLDFSKITINV